jgi:hypothetical protein
MLVEDTAIGGVKVITPKSTVTNEDSLAQRFA